MDATVVICAACGQENPAGFSFCGACGAALAGQAPTDVRKTVTIVFCDLVGSTALGERTDPEVLRDVMARYHAELRAILERHGGTVEKFVGDAAMAVFGLPQVHEDDALRAVRAAVEMRDAVATLGLEVRIGVNTGEVVAGTGETLATGDAVNVAARLEQAAEAGEVLIGSVTQRLVRDAVRAEAVEPLVLKGKQEPVAAFRVLGLVDEVAPAFTRPIDAPFVGRRDELEELERALALAVETRTPQLATIVGAPGIGKSRLARELLGRVQARVVVGRCLPYGEGITYWPLQEIASQVGDVRATLQGVSDAELAAIRVEAALGVTDTPVSPEEIAWGVRRLFEVLAVQGPLVVVFDDIHWAESAFLDLIEYLASFVHDAPMLVLCTARPDLFDVRPSWTAPKPSATLVTLQPLSEDDSETLVERLGRPAGTRASSASCRQPRGTRSSSSSSWRMQAESGDELEVPPTLQALLAARIDRLGRAGARCCPARLGRGTALPPRRRGRARCPSPSGAEVGAHLLSLVRKELIRPDRATLPGDDAFRFGHILIRDAAYDAIPKRQRAALHERVRRLARSEARRRRPDEVVGYHLEQAYRYGAELGAVDPNVGRRAAERLANGRARSDGTAGRCRDGKPAYARRRARSRRRHAPAPLRAPRRGSRGSRRPRASSGGVRGRRGARARGRRRPCRMARASLARPRAADAGSRGRAGPHARGGDRRRRCARTRARLRGARRSVGTHRRRPRWRGETGAYMDALERALQHARQAGSLALEVSLAAMRAPDFIWGPGRVEEGVRYADELVERLGHVPGVQQFALHLHAHMRARLGEFEGALEAMSTYRDNLRELGKEREYAVTAGCVWDVCSWSGDLQHGEEALREAYEQLEQRGTRHSSRKL